MRWTVEVAGQAASLVANNGFAARDFLFPLAQIVGGNRLQIVNVVEVNVVHEVHIRIDVSRDGDVDEKQRGIFSQLHQRLQPCAVNDVMRSGRAADDDVNVG